VRKSFLKALLKPHFRGLHVAVVCILAIALIAVLPARRSRAQGPGYTVIDLGTVGLDSRAYGINNCGSVVGDHANQPAYWKRDGLGVMVRTDLGSFGGDGSAYSVNAAGFVAGYSETMTELQQCFIWHDDNNNGVSDAGELQSLMTLGAAFGINDLAQVAGVADTSVGGTISDAAFVWDAVNKTKFILPANGVAPIRALNIGETGHVVGIGQVAGSEVHAFTSNGSILIDLGSLGGGFSAGQATKSIIGSDYVVGYSLLSAPMASKPYHAFLWHDDNGNNFSDPGELRDLGTLVGPNSPTNSIAYDINANGEVVGSSDITLPSTVMHAFIWHDDNSSGTSDLGEMKDLNLLAADPNWVLQDARAINDSGQIVGFGINVADPTHTHAFLLNPVGFSPTPCSTASTTVSAVSGSGVYNAPATLTATLNSLAGPLSGKTINFSIDMVPACGGGGQPVCPTTNASGVATVNVSGYDAGAHSITASFAGDSGFAASNNTGTLTISKASATIALSNLAHVYDGNPKFATATTNPPGLSGVTINYFDSLLTPVASPTFAGSYGVVASLSNANYQAPNASGTLVISQASSTTAVTVSNATYDGSPHGATAVVTGAGGLNQSLTVSYTGISGTTYDPSSTAPTGAGTYTAAASYGGDINHTGSSHSQPFTITKASQTITVNAGAPTTATYNSQFTVAATASSTLAVAYSSGSPTICTNNGPVFIMISGTGTCNVKYEQTGDDNRNAAPPVTENVSAQKASTTTIVTVSNATYDGSPHGGSATVAGTGGLNQSLTVTYTGITTTYGPSTIAPTNAGQYSAEATFTTDSNYALSNDTKSFTIAKASQTITFGALPNKTFGDAPFNVNANGGGSSKPVTFSAAGNCSSGGTNGSTITITGAGSCTVTASQAGDANYNAASNVPRSFTIATASQTIIFGALLNKAVGDAPFTVNATGGGSSSPVLFSASGNCTSGGTNGSTITITGAGNCTVTASQAGDTNYVLATPVSQSFAIVNASSATAVSSSVNPSAEGQSVTFTATVSSSGGGTPSGMVQFKADAINLGLPVTLVAGVATTSTSSLSVGTHTITADYSGDANFAGSIGSLAGGQVVGGVIQFSQPTYTVDEGQAFLSINVTRTGNTAGPATVKYATSDATDVNFACNPNTVGQITGAASRKCDYHIAAGRLRFAAGETSKTIVLSIVNDVYVEGAETLTVGLSNPTGGTLGSPNLATVTITDNDVPGQANPIDGTAFYVRMLYVDLLSREPDPAGNAGWIHRIDFCGQPGEPPPPCDRVTVGGDGFLRSTEFFDREFFVIRLYRTALGRILRYDDVADLAFVSGFLTDADLELNKQEVVSDIMSRSEFGTIYNSLGNSQYVDALIQTAGVSLPGGIRDGWVNALNGSTKTRAQVFRELSERAEVSAKYLHEAQVVSCYYGFFTRNPDGAYFNYLQRLDSGEINLGDLANAFINAAEYRQRFGP
jgi:probable HAF family extracellular repeat protein